MVGPEFFDAFLLGGYLPNVKSVTLESPDGSVSGLPLEARREPTDEQMFALAGVEAGTETRVFFFAVGQAGFERPRNNWVITDDDGTKWMVVRDDLTISDRGVPVICTRYRK